jgi:Pentatricopeptide repeat domain
MGTVLKGLSKSGSRQGAEMAEGQLRRMLNLQNQEKWKDLEVNTIHYTTVLQAYANAGDPTSAQRLLMEMLQEAVMNGNERVLPNIRSFNAVLSAWSKSSMPNAYEMAEELIRRVLQLHENGVLKEPPDTVSYNCLLATLAKRPHQVPDPVATAETLVQDLLQRSASNPTDASCQPTLVTFNALIRILEANNPPDKNDKLKFWIETARKYGIEEGRFLRDREKHPTKYLKRKDT